MYKVLSFALLLVASLLLAQEKQLPAANLQSPVIVARERLVNQTAPIPTTTIFTPRQTGLYRLSVYMTMSRVGTAFWGFNFNWSDDGGAESSSMTGSTLISEHKKAPPNAYAYSDFTLQPGAVVTFEAIANVPVTYSVTQTGSASDDIYSLYYTIERLE
jgi:hypothetical protein